MPAIHLTDRSPAVRALPNTRALTRAATVALSAPSIFNSQPWRWRIHDELAELRCDPDRQLTVVDPDGRLMTLSCGTALHHATVALAGNGLRAAVSRLPDPDQPDLLATIRVAGAADPDGDTIRLRRAISIRRTDRRPFASRPVPAEALDRLRAAVDRYPVHLHLLDADQVPLLSEAATLAAVTELADGAYRAELAAWTNRPAAGGEGVPATTAGPLARRRVPVRDFAPDIAQRSRHPGLADRYGRYLILSTAGDERADWLAAGEALSAVLLTATADGLATSPMSDVVEVPAARRLLGKLSTTAGVPMIAVRVGVPADGRPVPATPRRN